MIINVIIFSVKRGHGDVCGYEKKILGICGYAFLWIGKSRLKNVLDYPISHFCTVAVIFVIFIEKLYKICFQLFQKKICLVQY